MIIDSKLCIKSYFFLFNEKVCYRFSKKKINTGSFIRFNFRIICYSDINLISFFFLSLPFFSNSVYFFKNLNRSFFLCRLFSSTFYKIMPFIFFSFFHFYIGSRFSYFWSYNYKNVSNNSIMLSTSAKFVSFFGFFDDYFYGILDANYIYQVHFSIQYFLNLYNLIFLNLFSSLFCIPFVNKRVKK